MTEFVDREDDPQWREWKRWAINEMLPGLGRADFLMGITDGTIDVTFACQIGVAVLQDKPIIIGVVPGAEVSEKMTAVADSIVVMDVNDEEGTQRRLQQAITDTLRKHGLDPNRLKGGGGAETLQPVCQEMGHRETALGWALYVRIHDIQYRPMLWTQVWEKFADCYPGQAAVQVFPPADRLVDQENIYHLFVLDGGIPQGLDIHASAWGD